MFTLTKIINLRLINPASKFKRLTLIKFKVTDTKHYCTQMENFIPRRALMYVPAGDERKLNKAFTLKVDCIAMDCEDGVAINKKHEARANIKSILHSGKPEIGRPYDLGVRVNSIDTPFFCDDIKSILSGPNWPDTILLPKVNAASDLQKFTEHVQRFDAPKKKFNLIIYIESALAVINLVDICKAAFKYGKQNNFVPVALVFGGDDFLANIGAAKSDDCSEVVYARQKFVLVAKAFNLQAIDVVHINFKDLNALQVQCEQGARLGFTGKQVIHPCQISVVQKAFLPSKEQVEWATSLLKTFEEQQKLGVGAFTFRESMIDMPTMRQAQNILKLMKSDL